MIPVLHVSLLGNFLLLVDETPLPAIMLPRIQALLAYLVLHRDASLDRSHLAFLFWPDSTEAQAHTNLRQLLHHLRQTLPHAEHFLRANKHSLQWLPVASEGICTLDIQQLEEAILQAKQAEQEQNVREMRRALEQVMKLYRGDLLPGCYEEWILPERDRLRQSFLLAAQRLVALLEQERDYGAAITVAHALLNQDPLHEASYRDLMRLYALQGDRATALRLYHTCASVLERELGAEPSVVTREIYESLLHADKGLKPGKGALYSERSTEAPLLGRKAEWRQLQEIWRAATGGIAEQKSGRAQLVILSGEAGIGKTRLAKELELWVNRSGMAAASARCYRTLEHLAYAPVSAWLRSEALQVSLSTLDASSLLAIARLVPEVLAAYPQLSPPDVISESWQQQHFFAALARAVLSVRRPLLLLLDDLQWCDQETLQWLQYLVHFAPAARVLFVGTVRVEETSPVDLLVAFLGVLQSEGLVTEIALAPLSRSETTALAEYILNRKFDPGESRAFYQESEGNPFFAVEMARAGTEKQSQKVQSNRQRLLLASGSSRLPSAIQAVLATRLAQLSEQARTLANVASVIGREFSFAVLAEASGASEEDLVRGLDELWQRRIVREHGGEMGSGYDFSHDKLREQTYTSLSSAHRRLLHRRVAEALQVVSKEEQYAGSGQIAAHYEQAGLPEFALPFYQRAGELASQIYANAEALHLLKRAVAVVEAQGTIQQDLTWESVVQVYCSLGDIFSATGAHEEARQTYARGMARLPEGAQLWRARLYWKIANTWKHASTKSHDTFYINAQQAFEEAERILSQVADPGIAEWRDEWIALQFAQIWPGRGSVEDMAAAIEKARPLVEEYGTKEQRRMLAQVMGIQSAIRSRYVVPAEKVFAWRAAIAAMGPMGSETQRGMELAVLGIGLLSASEYDDAEEQLSKALRIGERTGNAWLQKNCLTFLLFVFRHRDQPEEVRRLLVKAQSLGVEQNNSILAGHQAWLAWRDGELEFAEAYGREAVEEERYQQIKHNPFLWTGRWPLIGVALTKGQVSVAIDNMRLLFDPEQQPPPENLSALLERVLQAWDGGKHDEMQSLFQQMLLLGKEMCYL